MILARKNKKGFLFQNNFYWSLKWPESQSLFHKFKIETETSYSTSLKNNLNLSDYQINKINHQISIF